jgi:1-acyl-sn-glycerol-3-phosphate acyltransferase
MVQDDLPTLPDCIPTTKAGFSTKIGLMVLSVLGWKIVGELPHKSKMLVAVAPHTSNWDFVIGIAAMLALNLRISFLGKKAIFIWPFKAVLQRWGGIGVDRKAKHGVVKQMVDKFQHSEQLVLAIAPEGTRSKTKEWKSGFLHIAHQAKVPVVPASLDFSKKQLRFHPAMNISENIELELVKIKSVFASVCAKNPQAV